jgi:hypothetical protein
MQHDCHEALTFILSIAHEEETKLLKGRQQHSTRLASDNCQGYSGVIARNFGIEERVELTVLAHCCDSVKLPIVLNFTFFSTVPHVS